MIRNHNPLHKSYYEKFADGTVKCIDEEIPFEIPESWEWVKLGDIGKWQSGATPNRSNKDYYNGDILWLKTGDLTDNYIYDITETITQKALQETSVKLNPKGSVLLAMYGATIGKVGILTVPATTNQACCACSEFRGIHNIFLFYLLIAYREYFIHIGEGGAQPNISKEKIISTYIPLPSLEEQKRIVFEITHLFSLIDSLEESKISLEQFITQTKTKILDLAIRGKLVPQDPTDEPASVLLERIKKEHPESKKRTKKTSDNSHYPFEIPKNWEWCKLGEFNNIARGGSPRPIKDFLTESKDGINWIKIGDTEKGEKYIYSTREKITKEGIKHSRFVNIDDFLLTNSMSFGRPYILKTDGCIHDGWLVINIQKKLINMDFMYYLLSSDFMYTQFYKSAVGSTVKNLKTETVQQIPFPLPPILEQKRIVQKIEEIFASLDEIANSIIA